MLKNKTGDDFDKAFIEQMIIHHQGAIEMATLVLLNEFKKMMAHSMEPKIELLMDEERRHLQLLYSLEKK